MTWLIVPFRLARSAASRLSDEARDRRQNGAIPARLPVGTSSPASLRGGFALSIGSCLPVWTVVARLLTSAAVALQSGALHAVRTGELSGRVTVPAGTSRETRTSCRPGVSLSANSTPQSWPRGLASGINGSLSMRDDRLGNGPPGSPHRSTGQKSSAAPGHGSALKTPPACLPATGSALSPVMPGAVHTAASGLRSWSRTTSSR